MYPALDHIIAFVYITQKHTVLYSAYSIYGISIIIFVFPVPYKLTFRVSPDFVATTPL